MASSYNELFGLGSHTEDTALLGWWNLQDDAASTTITDGSSNGNNGTFSTNTNNQSTTGPNSWLTKGIDHAATHYATMGTGYLSDIVTNGEFSISMWIYYNPHSDVIWSVGDANGLGDANGIFEFNSGRSGANREFMPTSNSNDAITNSLSASTWRCIGGACDLGSNDSEMYVNGSSVGTETTFVGSHSLTNCAHRIGSAPNTTRKFNGRTSGAALFERRLTTAEFGEIYNGPEPVNSVAPSATGTGAVGETLTTTSGTWGLDSPFSSGSNGTITYTYQWTRSDDESGTGESNIFGATSSSYTVVEADSGKFLRCVVSATNDGGNDSAADTNSNMIQITGSPALLINGGLINRNLVNGGVLV